MDELTPTTSPSLPGILSESQTPIPMNTPETATPYIPTKTIPTALPETTTVSTTVQPAAPISNPSHVKAAFDLSALLKKLPYIVGMILVLALIFLAIVYVVIQQQQPPQVAVTPTPTSTPTEPPILTPTPFPIATVTKSIYLSLMDGTTVKNIAEIAPDGTVASIKTPDISPYEYVKTDKQNAVTEFGQVSPNGKYRAKVMPTAIEFASTETPNTFIRIAKSNKGQYVYGYFISDTQYAFSHTTVSCNLARTCTQQAKSTTIYDAVTNKFYGLPNTQTGVPGIYLGASDEYFFYTNKSVEKNNTYYLVGKKSYVLNSVIIPPAIFSTIIWGPQLDIQRNRIMYLSKGFADTIEIGYYDLKAKKEVITTEIPALVEASKVTPGKILEYNMHYFKNFSQAYIALTYVQGEVEFAYKTYYYSEPDEQAKEFIANPELKPFFLGSTATLVYDPATAQSAVMSDLKNILVIDTKDLAQPAIKDIPILGILPTYNSAVVSGWKE